VRFSAVESLVGGTQSDHFAVGKFGSLSGDLIGDSGKDTLDYSGYNVGVTVDLANFNATAIAGQVFNMDNVIGTSVTDTLIGDGADNELRGAGGDDILVGNGGADYLDGANGRDLLIGGAGGDKLIGGSGDDLLINGSTAHDGSIPSLKLIMKEWARLDQTFLQRINHLRNGGGLNGGIVFNGLTVTHDLSSDSLEGNSGSDWFWAKAPDLLADFSSAADRLN
jgi:Ca2+-binding RTX toxin-like protein